MSLQTFSYLSYMDRTVTHLMPRFGKLEAFWFSTQLVVETCYRYTIKKTER